MSKDRTTTGEGAGPGTSEPASAPPPMGRDAPVLRLLTAEASEEEIAALVVVLAAAGAPPPEDVRADLPRSRWAAPERLLRASHRAGPGGWRASGLPR